MRNIAVHESGIELRYKVKRDARSVNEIVRP